MSNAVQSGIFASWAYGNQVNWSRDRRCLDSKQMQCSNHDAVDFTCWGSV